MKKLREILGEKFSKEMETWLQNNKITKNMKAREPAEAPSKPSFDRAAFDAKMADMKKKIDAEGPFITNKQSQSVHWDDKIADRINRIQIRTDAPKTVIPEPVDFTGSRHSAGSGDVKVVDDSLNKNWRSKKEGIGSYQQPPGFGTPYPVEGGKLEPSNKKMRDAYDAMGIRTPTYSDPLKTVPAIPVTADKPYVSGKENSALAAKGYDKTGKKVTAIPKQTGVGRAETPLSSNVKIPSGVGITTPGSFTYSDTETEKTKKKITDRVKDSSYVPQSAINPKEINAGPIAPGSNYKTYADNAKRVGSASYERKASDKKEEKPQTLWKISKGNTLEGIARKVAGKDGDWKKVLKSIREKNPNVKEKALKIGSELILPEETATQKRTTSRIKPEYLQTLVPSSAVNPPVTTAGPFITGTGGKNQTAYNFKVPGLLDKNVTVATKQPEETSVPKPKLRPRISDDEAFVKALKDQESKFNPKAISPKGAAGLMQVMPDTGKEIAGELGDTKYPKRKKAQQKYLQDPKMGELYGLHYLNKMYTKSALELGTGDEEKLRKSTLAAYNAGFAGSRRYRESLKSGEGNLKLLSKETRAYVPSILQKYKQNKTSSVDAAETPTNTAEQEKIHKVTGGDSAIRIAQKYKMSLPELEKLNPGISKKSSRGKLYPGDTVKVK